MESVFDLAREDTQLKKVAASEYAGPCPAPGCGGRDRFHVNLNRRNGLGGWMCRVCHPAEIVGWGDDVDYLVAIRGMSKRDALRMARNQVESLLDQAREARVYAAPDDDQPPKAPWQEKQRGYVERAVSRLWSPAGRAALEYARARGLEDATIKAAQLGFSVDQDQAGNTAPYLVIPWHVGGEQGGYWAINRRDMHEDKPDDAPRYKMLYGSSKQGLYGGALLERSRKFATFMVEGEIDALILAQEARGLDINIVATGGQSSILTRWAIRLARMPLVLLSQDNEARGQDQARAWLDVLQSNAMRYRPLAKDVNAMHLEGWSVRTWVEAALDMLQPVEPTNVNRTLPASSREDQAARTTSDQFTRTTPNYSELVDQAPASSAPDSLDARVIAALPGAPSSVQIDIAILLSVFDQDQAATWLRDARVAWLSRDSAALAEYGEQIDYPGALFVSRLGLQLEQVTSPTSPTSPQLVRADQSGDGLQLEQPTISEQDAGAAFLDQVNSLVAGIWPDGWSSRLVDDAFTARIHALPDQPPARPAQRSILEALPRRACPFTHVTVTCKPSPCKEKPRPNGWCGEHQQSALLLTMGATLDYPRVEISDCNVIPAGRASWERYAISAATSLKAALPRVKRLLDQAQRDQDQAAS